MAAEAGIEPATSALTGRRTTVVLLGNKIPTNKKALGLFVAQGLFSFDLWRVF
jgi:hypothetical protein